VQRRLVLVLAVLVLGAAAGAAGSSPASAHRDPCHPQHACPSDHASYRWRGMLCVKPTSDKRTPSFRKRVVYDGRTYLCKR